MKKIKILMLIAAVAAISGCCQNKSIISAKSPDGRNEIRLYSNPLSYEVFRDGVLVVGKSEIGLKVNAKWLLSTNNFTSVVKRTLKGYEPMAIYKKDKIDLSATMVMADNGVWGVDLIARNDGVAYRFRTHFDNEITIDDEKADIVVPNKSAQCWYYSADGAGYEEEVARSMPAIDIYTFNSKNRRILYMPFVYSIEGKYVVASDSDVYDYPVWNIVRDQKIDEPRFESKFERFPKKTVRSTWGAKGIDYLKEGGRWLKIIESEDYIVKTSGNRSFPWRCFMLADSPNKFCENDLIMALARPAEPRSDFSWVKPGKVAWDWWNCFDNKKIPQNGGCNTKTYERFIDFASQNKIEYVIFDEGWSEKLNIWKFHPDVDVPHLISYADKKGVGIILWMAWAQVYGREDEVASHFAKLGVKGFKVDFMDRADADAERFLWKFAKSCANHKLVIDYHGVHRPTGLSRAFPNVLNYEGIHGLEQTKWYSNNYDFMLSDVRAFFMRQTLGAMDYTPGAMLNFPIGKYVNKDNTYPGSIGTRCRQIAMMSLFEAPLQMLCDSPTHYEANIESFKFMAETPVVWADTKSLPGDITLDTMAGVARKTKSGNWYVAAINNSQKRSYDLNTSFLDGENWEAQIFKDAPDCSENPQHYICQTLKVKRGDILKFDLASGGGFAVKFIKLDK